MQKPSNDNAQRLTDEDIERIAQRVTAIVFRKLMGRLARFATMAETVPLPPPCESPTDRINPTDADFALVRARRARKGR
jgi:hypothetical protein